MEPGDNGPSRPHLQSLSLGVLRGGQKHLHLGAFDSFSQSSPEVLSRDSRSNACKSFLRDLTYDRASCITSIPIGMGLVQKDSAVDQRRLVNRRPTTASPIGCFVRPCDALELRLGIADLHHPLCCEAVAIR
jgi:hypothetical protein